MTSSATSPGEVPAMRMPRVRFTIGRMMVIIAIVAVGLGWISFLLHLPDPSTGGLLHNDLLTGMMVLLGLGAAWLAYHEFSRPECHDGGARRFPLALPSQSSRDRVSNALPATLQAVRPPSPSRRTCGVRAWVLIAPAIVSLVLTAYIWPLMIVPNGIALAALLYDAGLTAVESLVVAAIIGTLLFLFQPPMVTDHRSRRGIRVATPPYRALSSSAHWNPNSASGDL
jgi:competence protein ComGC